MIRESVTFVRITTNEEGMERRPFTKKASVPLSSDNIIFQMCFPILRRISTQLVSNAIVSRTELFFLSLSFCFSLSLPPSLPPLPPLSLCLSSRDNTLCTQISDSLTNIFSILSLNLWIVLQIGCIAIVATMTLSVHDSSIFMRPLILGYVDVAKRVS